jgi:hypothetical protein
MTFIAEVSLLVGALVGSIAGSSFGSLKFVEFEAIFFGRHNAVLDDLEVEARHYIMFALAFSGLNLTADIGKLEPRRLV